MTEAFDFVATRDDVEHGKPAPEIYQLVARELDTPPSESLVIEDSPSGVKAALAAGMWCIAVTTLLTRREIHKRLRRGRAGTANFVPTSTGAAIATTKALPQYAGKFDGVAVRAPVPIGSISDIVFLTERKTTIEEVSRIFKEESESERYKGILGVTEDPIVSSDIIEDPRAAIIDLGMTRVVDGDLVKVMSWYDNEWGYSNQMIREALRIARGSNPI